MAGCPCTILGIHVESSNLTSEGLNMIGFKDLMMNVSLLCMMKFLFGK